MPGLLFFRTNQLRLKSLGLLIFLPVLPFQKAGISLCWFKHITGHPCPFCGLIRSMSAFLSFKWGDSFAFHPLGGMVVFLLISCLITNRIPFSKLKCKFKNRIIHILLSVRFLILLFLLVWIFRLMNCFS